MFDPLKKKETRHYNFSCSVFDFLNNGRLNKPRTPICHNKKINPRKI
jgi:hypothetical protein